MKLDEKIIDYLVFRTSKERRLETFFIAVLLTISIAFLDYVAGPNLSVFTLYLIPILYVVSQDETPFGYALTFSCSVISEFTNGLPANEVNGVFIAWYVIRRTAMLAVIVFFFDLAIKLMRRYHSIVEDQNQFVCRYKQGGQLTFSNNVYADFYHVDRQTLSTYNIFDTIVDDDRENVITLLSRISRDNPAIILDYRSLLPNKQVQWQRWSHVAIFNLDGSISEIQAVGRDITERKKYQDLKEQVEKIMLHDIKGPLTGIIGLSEIMLKDRDLPERQKDYLDSIKDAGNRILNMVGSSLDLYKMEHGTYIVNKEDVDLTQIINSLLTNYSNHIDAKNLSVQLYLDNEKTGNAFKYNVSADKMITITMIENLLKNALEATPPSQNVSIIFSTTQKALSICNSGEVPREIRENFFEKFVTSKKTRGTGLGTYSAALVARAHGWKIDLDTSVPGHTKITIHFENTL